MEIQAIDYLKEIKLEQLKELKRSDLLALFIGEQQIRIQMEKRLLELEEEKYEINQKYLIVKNMLFGASSEKSKKPELEPEEEEFDKKKPGKKNHNKRKAKLTERYPNLEVVDKEVELGELPKCKVCESVMTKSGMYEEREQLSVIPKKYFITKYHHAKYKCTCCHGSMVTAPSLPRIKPGSFYDDSLIIDVTLSKYCDLIPIERYMMMARRLGVRDLPANSLIELTHYLADYLKPVYLKIKKEIQSQKLIFADETPHKMLEGDPVKNWFLWGFSSLNSVYYLAADTRSGNVAENFFKESNCEYLMTDDYGGYQKAVEKVNEERKNNQKPVIMNIKCNAHSRRKFDEAKLTHKEAESFILNYQEIYRLDKLVRNSLDEVEKLSLRKEIMSIFEKMKRQSHSDLPQISSKSNYAKAINYFLKNYEKLVYFTQTSFLPIDNNHQERQMRNPVIGRKTWYGTHSKTGAETNSIHFSVTQSCKLNNVSPPQFYKFAIKQLHEGKEPFTPYEYKIYLENKANKEAEKNTNS